MSHALLEKQNVLGVGITPTSYQEVVDTCQQWLNDWWKNFAEDEQRFSAAARYITVTSVHGIISSVLHSDIRACINNADIATPDGMPVVWALRSFGRKGQKRVYGPNLTLALCEMAAKNTFKVFLYGSREETLAQLKRNLCTRIPGLEIVGTYSPPFRSLTPEESVAISDRIVDSGAQIVLVGLSTPKQERWMLWHSKQLPRTILVGVGAAFDFHAGTLRQAPLWMQDAGLEWAFRLFAEPKRLWKRYLLVTPLFLPLWALQKTGFLRFFPRFSILKSTSI